MITRVLLYTHKHSVVTSFKKISIDFRLIKEPEEVYDIYSDNDSFILLFDIDSYDSNFFDLFNELKQEFTKMHVIVLTNQVDVVVGSALLREGVKAYIYSYTNRKNITQALEVVSNGNIWLYPEMMNYIMQKLPQNESHTQTQFTKLSTKEKRVAELVSLGNSNKEIAKTMDLAEVTIKKTLSEMYKKLEVKDRVSLALKIKSLL